MRRRRRSQIFRKRDPFFLTLPDDVDLYRIKARDRVTKKIFLYFFSFFRYLIFKDFLPFFFAFDNFFLGNCLIRRLRVKANQEQHERNWYAANIFLMRSSTLSGCTKLKLHLVAKSDRLLSYLAIRDIRRGSFGKLFFYKKKMGLVLFEEFKFRVPFLFYLAHRNLSNFLKAYKYNEYLNRTCDLYFYPLLRVVLRGQSRMRRRFYKKFKSLNSILPAMRFYYDRSIFLKQPEKWKECSIPNNIQLLMNSNSFIKIFKLNKKAFPFLYKYAKLPFLNCFFLFVYDIWAYVERRPKEYANPDALNSYKWRIYYIFHLYWFLHKYDDEFPKWVFLIISLKICKVIVNSCKASYNLICLSTLRKDRYNQLANSRLCALGVKMSIFLAFFKRRFNNAHRKASVRVRKRRATSRVWRRLWKDAVKRYLFRHRHVSWRYYNDNKAIMEQAMERAHYYDLVHWKIWYGGNQLGEMKQLNILNISKNIQGDSVINSEYLSLKLNLKAICLDKKQAFLNQYLLIWFLRELFFKLIFNNFFYFSKNYNYLRNSRKMHANYNLKFFIEKNKALKGYSVYWDYFDENREWFRVKMGKFTCYAMCVNIVTYSFKVS